MKCHYCGYDNVNHKKANPKRCPQCGNYYGYKPKRNLWGRFTFILLAVAVVTISVSATSLNFQNPVDNTSIIAWRVGSPTTSTIQWQNSTLGDNNYVVITNQGAFTFTGIALPSPSQTTYAAATLITAPAGGGREVPSVVLYDSTGAVLYQCINLTDGWTPAQVQGRWEVKVSGGTAYVYINNSYFANSTPLAANPSYVAFGTMGQSKGGFGGTLQSTSWDDYTYGTGENKYILGLPESDGGVYIILKDIINPSSSGLAYGSTGAVVDSNYMKGTWGRGNLSLTPGSYPNETIELVNYETGTVYSTNYTNIGSNLSGSVKIDINTLIINSGAPMGFYALTIPGTGAYSNQIIYKSNGASVAWSAKKYSVGDSGTVITTSTAGGYWDTSTYSYKLAVMDVYGQFHGSNATISTQTQTTAHTWSSSDNPGVYYAIMYATKLSGGTQYIIGYDYTTLSAYANYAGWVNIDENATILSGANVNMTQGTTICNTTSAADGSYNCTGFSTGSTLYVNATESLYQQYLYNWTPMAAKTVALNITLSPITHTFTGLAIGGVDRETLYGRPIAGAQYTVRNTSLGTYYTKSTNNVGYALCDEGATCMLATKTPYDVWGYKLGYQNSTTYKAVTA